MPVNPVMFIHTDSTWIGVKGGILTDAIGEQYQFLTDQTTMPEGRVCVDYETLSEEEVLWISRIYDNQRWPCDYDRFDTD